MNQTPYEIATDAMQNHKSMKFRTGNDEFQTFIYKKTNEGFLIHNNNIIFEIDVFRKSEHKNYPAVIHFLYNNEKQEIFRSYQIDYSDVKQLLGRHDLEDIQSFISRKMIEENGPSKPPRTKIK